jgi:transcriptional regulator with XRE-family HTH domain
MSRWKSLPEALDPAVKEFTSQLRRLVDRSGLSIAAVADRTGYSKTSWERYLGGRLIPPKGAVVALAEVTGTPQIHLTTMWELAERAWSRSEARHDMTMEALRISQARTALAESGANPIVGPDGPGERLGSPNGSAGSGGRPAGATIDFRHGFDADADHSRTAAAPQGSSDDANSPRRYPSSAQSHGPAAGQTPGGSPGAGQKRGRRKATIFVSVVVGALVVVGAAFALTSLGGDDGGKKVAESSAPAPFTSREALPEGVKCAGAGCTGKDPEDMGCSGTFAKTVASVTVGESLVEVRYSKTCQAAWARITQAALGDKVRITPTETKGKGQSGTVEKNTNAYTAMSAVPDSASVKACGTLVTGETACTTPR